MAALLSKTLKLKKDEKDIVVMRVDIAGKKGSKNVEYRFELIDYYDDKLGITAMARTTAYPCSIVSLMVGRGDINERGVIPPERLGMNPTVFETIKSELSKRNIHISFHKR